MPDLRIPESAWEGDAEGVVTQWFYADGALVKQGELIGDYIVEKTQLEIYAPASGRLRILKPIDARFTKGDVIARVEAA